MAKVRTTLTIDESVLRAVKIKAARDGRRDGEVIEEAVRAGLGMDVLERIWAESTLGPEAAMELALEAQHETRRKT